MTGSGDRYLRVAESEILRIAGSEVYGCGKLWNQKFTDSWVKQNTAVAGSGVNNLRVAKSEVYACGRQWGLKFTVGGVRRLRL